MQIVSASAVIVLAELARNLNPAAEPAKVQDCGYIVRLILFSKRFKDPTEHTVTYQNTQNMTASYALVTGANQGIGFEIARGLGKIGFTPILGCRNLERAKEAAKQLEDESNIHSEIVQLDVTNDASITAAAKTVEELVTKKGGSFDLLVNNAGIASTSLESFRDNFNAIMNTNVTSVAIIMDTFVPLLQKSTHALGGQIINVTSTRGSLTMTAEGKLPPTRSAPYSVSKAAENLLSLDYSIKYKGSVRINACCPGHCGTQLNGYAGLKTPAEGARVVLQVAVDPEVGTGGFYRLEGTEKYTRAPW